MLPLGQKWLLTRLRSLSDGICTGASFTNIEYNLHDYNSNLYYTLLEKINSILAEDPLFDSIKDYLEARHAAFIRIKEELLRGIESFDRTNLTDRIKFYRRLLERVSQQVPFPFIEERRELVDLMDKIILHQNCDRIKQALILPRNQERDLHLEIMHLFNPDVTGKTKRVASFSHVLAAEKFRTFFRTLSETFNKASANALKGTSICFFDQTHMITLQFVQYKGWVLADINQGEAKYYSDDKIAKKIVKSLPDSVQESNLLFSCKFYGPVERAEEVEKLILVWRNKSVMKKVSEVTKQAANFKVIGVMGKTLSWLDMAVAAQDVEKAIQLLNYIDNWDEYTYLFPAIFHLAIKENKIELVTSLLQKGLSVNCIYDGRNPFHLAAAYGREEILDLLIDNSRGLNLQTIINEYDDEGYTPLAIATEEKQTAIVKKLLSYLEVLPNLACKSSKTPLFIAVANRDCDMVSTLLGLGADPNITFDDRNCTPLHLAVLLEDIDLVKLLLDHKAIVQALFYDTRKKWMNTLELAQTTHNEAIIDLLNSKINEAYERNRKTLGTIHLPDTFSSLKIKNPTPSRKKRIYFVEETEKEKLSADVSRTAIQQQLAERREKLRATKPLIQLQTHIQDDKKVSSPSISEKNKETRLSSDTSQNAYTQQLAERRKKLEATKPPTQLQPNIASGKEISTMQSGGVLPQYHTDSQLKVQNTFLTSEVASVLKKESNKNKLLIEGLSQLIDNIDQQKNGRATIWYNVWKSELLRKIQTRLQSEGELTKDVTQQYIEEIRSVCTRKRNSFHFWSEPHSVAEFENWLIREDVQLGLKY